MSRVGIIGCGNIAPSYVRTLAELGWIEVAGFADGVPERAQRLAAEHAALVGAERAGAAMAVDELLADASVDAVVNLTPAHMHATVTREVLAAGKAAFSEKPLGIDFDEGRALLDLARARRLRLGCASAARRTRSSVRVCRQRATPSTAASSASRSPPTPSCSASDRSGGTRTPRSSTAPAAAHSSTWGRTT